MSDRICETCGSVEKAGYQEPCVYCNAANKKKKWEVKSFVDELSLPLDHKPTDLGQIDSSIEKSVEDFSHELFVPNLLIDGDEEKNPFDTQVGGDHYKKADGCPDVAEWCGMQEVEFLEGNVIKYVFRHERKNGFEDLEKAAQYLKFIAWVKYKKELK